MKLRCAVAVVGLVLAAGCSVERSPDVVLITLDTTRADHLGCYGHPEPTTPNIDAFADEALLFSKAYSTNPITLPAHASILTGTYPLYHGVRNNSTYELEPGILTLAEILKSNGYTTSACIGSFVLDSMFGLDQGFDVYDDWIEASWARDEYERRAINSFGFEERKANMVTRAALDRLETVTDEPFFLWAHYFDPHEPHNPPEPHHSRFSDPYEAEIAFMDEQVGFLLAELRAMGRYDNTIVVIVSDHGEGRMDHGEPTHSLLIFDSTMQVPMIIKAPGGPMGHRVDDLASVVDVTPTILDLLGLPIPDHIQGMSLAPSFAHELTAPDREVYSESLMASLGCGWGELRSLRNRQEKLIHGPVPRYYRIEEDPKEIYDRAAENPEAVARLTERLEVALERWSRPDAEGAVTLVDSETAERLAAMGYLVGSVEASRNVTESLVAADDKKDPHENNALFDLFWSGREDIRQEQTLQGIRKLEAVVAADPGFKDAIKALAMAYTMHTGELDRARALFEQILVLDHYQDDAHYFLGKILAEQGDIDAAQGHYEAVLEFKPHSVPALFELAMILAYRGDQDRARRLHETALEIDPEFHQSIIALGSYHARRKEHEIAGEYFRRAREVAPSHPETLYNTAIWYLQEGDTPRAIAFLEQTIEVSPNDPDAHYVIGKLYLDAGRRDEARQSLRTARSLTTNPTRLSEIERLLAEIDAP